jgi:ABC-type multidrug transport system fused ATPase/permease subunit
MRRECHVDLIQTIRRAVDLIDPRFRRKLALVAGLGVLVSGLDLLAILLLAPFLGYLGPGGMQQNAVVRIASDLLGTSGQEELALVLALTATVLFVFKGILSVVLLWVQNGILNAAQVALAGRLVSAFVRAPWLVQQDASTGSFMRTTITAVQFVVTTVGSTIVMVSETAVLIAVFVAFLIINPTLAIATMAYVLLAGLLYLRLVRRPIVKRGQQLQYETERMNSSLIELVGGIKELVVYQSAYRYQERFQVAAGGYLDAFRLITVANQSVRYLLEILLIAGAALVIAMATITGSATTVLVSIGVLLAGGMRILPALNMALFSMNTIRSYEPGVLNVERELARLECAAPDAASRVQQRDGDVFAPSGAFAFDDVTFSYPGRARPALQDITFSVRAGEAIGVVGASGSGKSTLVDLLLGLLEPTTGTIAIDGEPLMAHIDEWRQRVGYVPQEIFLADDTLAANIAFARSDGSIDRSALDEATRLAHLDGVVRSLPEGIETMIGERGTRLSGGQRQRIGLARALYRRPHMLVLDEATSALDNETEQLIGQALSELHGKLTMLVIAHRLSTVRSCDRIIFLENGVISGIDSFAELDRTNEGFARLVQLGSLRGVI